MKKMRIFVASPSDMVAERTKVEEVVSSLKPLANNLEIAIEVVDWSSVVPDMGRPEQIILNQVEPMSWDVFIGILWHRFGTQTGEKDKTKEREYLSGTEEEFKTAYHLWQKYQRPRIVMYRCKRNIPPNDLDPDQYKRVQEFFSQFDVRKGEHPGLYQTFDSVRSFKKLLLDNLQKILLEQEKKPLEQQNVIHPATQAVKLFVCYQRSAKHDRALAEYLLSALSKDGHDVFIDTSMRIGAEWLNDIDENIKSSDYLVVLVSKESADSEMVQAEIFRAYEHRKMNGHPKTLPVRMNFEGLLPYTISAFLGQYQQAMWNGEQDNQRIADEISSVVRGQNQSTGVSTIKVVPLSYSEDGRAIYNENEEPRPLPEFDPRILDELAEPGGSIKLGDRFYIVRESDDKLKRAITKNGETITIRASRQTGKSSLLARGINYAHAKANIVYMDFQSIEHEEFESADRFMKYFAGAITRKLKQDVEIVDKIWQEKLGPQDKLVEIMEEQVLPASDRPIVLAIDEADRLLSAPFQNDFFALMRSWHNNRAVGPEWNKLNIAMVIATEPYLLISNPNQSPFNVGVRINLEDFNREQVSDLNHRHGNPVKDHDMEAFFKLLSGHPYLTRRALYLLVSENWTWESLYRRATEDQGPFADHLRRQLWFIRENERLHKGLQQVLHNNSCDDEEILWRLLRAGLIKGQGDRYYCRCGLYEKYFMDHLI